VVLAIAGIRVASTGEGEENGGLKYLQPVPVKSNRMDEDIRVDLEPMDYTVGPIPACGPHRLRR